MTANQITVFVEGIFGLYENLGEFIAHVRDFLIQMREKRGEDTEDLFLQERMAEIKQKKIEMEQRAAHKLSAIPGMRNSFAEENEIRQLAAFRNSQENNM